MFSWLSLQAKLVLAILLPAATLGISITYYQLKTVDTIESRFTDLIDNDFVQLDALADIKLYVLEMETVALRPHAATPASEKAEIEALAGKVKEAEKTYNAHVQTDDGDEDVTPLQNLNTQVDRLAEQAIALHATSLPAVQRDAQQVVLRNTREALTALLDATAETTASRVAAEDEQVKQVVATTKRTLLSTVALATLLAICVGLVIAARMARTINRLRLAAQGMANGDFSEAVHIKSRDEIGQLAAAFNQMSTRLKDSYQRLEVEKQRDEAILQGMTEGLVAVDETGKIVLMNELAARLLGMTDRLTAVNTPAQSAYQLYAETDKSGNHPLPGDSQPVLQALKTGQPLSGVFIFRSKDGTSRLLNITAAPVKLDSRIAGAIALVRDVTKEKEIDRMKTEFISLASHQLRTPLSAIKWFSEMLLSGDAGKLQADQEDFARNISESTERMIALVNALLNISRIESGRILVDPKPTDLKVLVTGIVNDLKAKTMEKQQALVISVHSDLPQINLDPRLIGQVYMNLLTNAIKYTPKGGEVSVFISRKDDQIISQVTDNGYGIPKEQQGRIFQKFFRAANAVKVETDGTGLGLYLIKAIVESSGGKIWFESEEGKGTTFWFSIPVTGMKRKEGEVTLDM